ncbi:helix-turn-helix domain-containing protein [Aeromonas sp. 603079]|uniref:helix-turn-helix domain-containing protein n=1 Tax=Aeromonas sp. 603079 TaxID=2712045 RepID=UPI003BA28D21
MAKAPILTIDDYAQDILEWIDANFNELPCLDDLALKLGYSKRMIQLHFKKTHGMTIGDYIHNRRLYRACVLLRMTELSISEIAYYLHFTNHQNFCRAFKRKLHFSPRAFRMLPVNILPSLQLPQVSYNGNIAHDLITLEKRVLLGAEFRYEDYFLGPNSMRGQVKLRRLQAWFQDNTTTLTIASEVERNDMLQARSRAGMISVSAIAGQAVNAVQSVDTPINTTLYTFGGYYLLCPFYGFFSDYAAHTKDIYMHLLPRLNLKRREGRDIEFFHFTPHIFDESPQIFCEHYIPVERNQ